MAQSLTSRHRFIPALPTLSPGMLLSAWLKRGTAEVFPFNAPSVHYYYFARNAVWETCRLLNLSGGEVLVPAYHHSVEIETLLAAGAEPVYYRVGRRWDVDLADVERLIGPRTRALYLIHYAGFPGPAAEMKLLADKHNLPLIEDCALSLLARHEGGKPLGSTGDVAFYSLYKMLPVPNGGAMVVNGPLADGYTSPACTPPACSSTLSHVLSSLLQNLEMRGGTLGRIMRKAVRSLGKGTVQAAQIERVTTGSDHFNLADAHLGMSNLSKRVLAALDMARVVRVRRRNYLYLLRQLHNTPAMLDMPPMMHALPPGACPLFYPLAVRDKAAVVERLQERGVEAIDFWRYFHPSCDPARFPDAAWLRQHVLEVPLHEDLTPSMMRYIAQTVREVVSHTGTSSCVDYERCETAS